MRLQDIISGISSGFVKEGDVFEAQSNGDRLIYKEGVLAWLTIGGYVSSIVTVTSENINEEYRRIFSVDSLDERGKELLEEKAEKEAQEAKGQKTKLTEQDVYNIHILYHYSKIDAKDIAEKYKISQRMVNYILRGEHWKEVFVAFHTFHKV